MSVYGNKVYTKDGKGTTCNGTTAAWPADASVTRMGAQTLLPFPMPATSAGRQGLA